MRLTGVLTQQIHDDLRLPRTLNFGLTGNDVFSQMAGQHFHHQRMHGALRRGDLYQQIGTIRFGHHCALQSSHLSANSADTGEQLLFISLNMRHWQ